MKLTRSTAPLAPSGPVNHRSASYRRPGARSSSTIRAVWSERASAEARAHSTAELVVTSPERAP
ncbi:hypothetical protein [Nocardioides hungaricus]